MRVLIADDDPIPRRLLEATLTKSGYEVVAARDGEEAWDILQRPDAPSLVILDWLMPGLDGVEVCRRLRQSTDGRYTYVLLLTSKDRKEDLVEGMEAGADDYLTKPFDPHELRVRLRAGQRILDLQSDLRASLEQLERARRREAEIGAKIQQTLLLGHSPQDLPGAQVATLTIPSQQIDGDFFDFYAHNSRCLDVVVGDVMGKGVPAALMGAAVKSHFLRALGRLIYESGDGRLPEPEEIVSAVHGEVTKQFIGLDSFETLCYARFDLARSRVDFVDCGHTATIHYQAGADACEALEGDNMPLGFSENEVYKQVSVPFAPGDVFFFYSDGVTEAADAEGTLFGRDRLMALVGAHAGLTPQALIETVRHEVVAYSQSETFPDDLTCVAIKILEAVGTAPLAQAHLEVSSGLADLVPLRAFVRGFCESCPTLDEDSLNQLELAAVEAASNIMRHAYGGRPDGVLRVEADAFADRVCLRLLHDGAAFDPGRARPPVFDGSREGGFGVYIIAQSVDEVTYAQDAQGRNFVSLVKHRRAG